MIDAEPVDSFARAEALVELLDRCEAAIASGPLPACFVWSEDGRVGPQTKAPTMSGGLRTLSPNGIRSAVISTATPQVTGAHSRSNCHSIDTQPEATARFRVRITQASWSPLTESNRRPSPYHGEFSSVRTAL